MKRGMILICFFAILVNIYILEVSILSIPFFYNGLVSVGVLGQKYINISSPLNTTYNFNVGDTYTIDLNVSPTNFEANSWWYTLWDLKHNEIVYNNVGFTPNTTFEAVRWSNKMAVYADDNGTNRNTNVTFYVEVPNSAPVLGGINSSIYVCENNFLSYYFNVTDVDEQNLELTISPTNLFYLFPSSTSGAITTIIELFSGFLDKDDVGIYKRTISVSDGEYADSVNTNITVIEINNAPVMSNIGVQTVWTSGDNSTFYKQVEVTDVEDGNQNSGNLTFNITFLEGTHLFNITNNGIMNFTPNSSQVGVYNISVCVNDTGIDNPHENISVECGQTGSSIRVCNNFSLTVTDENRAPTITDYYPNNLNLSVFGTDSLYFNISEYDPDGTIPDAYWYVNNVLGEYDSGSLIDEFTYSFGCGVSGANSIKAEITDGLLNDSITWTLDVSSVACPVSPEGMGGGGVTALICKEKWGCGMWEICQNAEKSLEVGLLSGEDYRNIKEQCVENKLEEKSCGMQTKTCFDFNLCNTTYSKPSEVQNCHYTEKPSCYDGIKNCHSGDCELLVDCGGPCLPCPTCSDKIKNQREEGIDCGGPCPWKCPEEKPLLKRVEILYLFMIIILILILIAIIKIVKIIRRKKSIKAG